MWRMLVCLGIFVLWAAIAAQPVTLYVAPDGNDEWSGRLAEPDPGGADGPLATLLGARDAVRRLRDEALTDGPVTVQVREGVYFMPEPLLIESADSGRPGAPVTYMAYPGERPVLSGGIQIDGWQAGADGVWEAPAPGDVYFHQLFVNGARRTRARTPNEGYFYTHGKAPPLVDPVTGAERSRAGTALVYAPGSINQWEDLADVNVVVFHSWETSRHRIAQVDEDAGVVTFTGRAAWPFERWGPRQRYYVENAPDALDAPGEWYLDQNAGVVRYLPLPDEDMEQAEVIAPVLPCLLRLRGQSELGLPVQNVIFRGLSLQHQDWELAQAGHSDAQAAVSVPAAVMLDGALDVTIQDCEIARVGGYGVWLRRGCLRSRVVRCHIHDLGAGGVRLGEAGPAGDDAAESRENLVDNNHIHDGGHVYAAGVGVWVAQSSHNLVSHNEIHDLNYSGMSVGWNWNDAPNRTHHNTIELNHVHHVMNGTLNDGGAIYTLGTSPGSIIRNNIFHDVWPHSAIGWGIYLDATTNQYLVANNIVYNVLSGGLMKHNGGHENVIENNIFAFSAHQMLWPCWDVRPNTFRRNIIYLTQGELFIPMAEGRLKQRLAQGDELGEWDHNLYFSPATDDLWFFGHTFEEWQVMGLDANSLVADPEFADPEAYDFRLAADSPALGLGFKPIDTSAVGLQGDEEWVAQARQVSHEPTVLPEPPTPAGPKSVDDGFENTMKGGSPEGFVVSGEERLASIRVTDERAASGVHSLRLSDEKGLGDVWQPHMYYRPNMGSGLVRQSFDLYLQPDVVLFTEWRDSGAYPDNIGPNVTFDGDGTVSASGKVLMIVPTEEWLHVTIECGVGQGAAKTYTVTLSAPGQEDHRFEELPFGGPDFGALHWLGFVCNADARATCYLDNLRVQLVQQ